MAPAARERCKCLAGRLMFERCADLSDELIGVCAPAALICLRCFWLPLKPADLGAGHSSARLKFACQTSHLDGPAVVTPIVVSAVKSESGFGLYVSVATCVRYVRQAVRNQLDFSIAT